MEELIMTKYQIKVTSVDYCVEDEDVIDYVSEDPTDEEIDNKIAEIKATLPQELDLEIECEPEDLEDILADTISEETGWLNNSFTYDVVSQEEVDEDSYDFFENIEIEVKGHTVYLAHDGSSGCEYEFKSKDELKQIIADYVADVIDYDYED
jgi:hypothetical protein